MTLTYELDKNDLKAFEYQRAAKIKAEAPEIQGKKALIATGVFVVSVIFIVCLEANMNAGMLWGLLNFALFAGVPALAVFLIIKLRVVTRVKIASNVSRYDKSYIGAHILTVGDENVEWRYSLYEVAKPCNTISAMIETDDYYGIELSGVGLIIVPKRAFDDVLAPGRFWTDLRKKREA